MSFNRLVALVSKKVKFEGFFAWSLIFYRQKLCKIIFANLKNFVRFDLRIPDFGFRFLVSGFRFPDSEFPFRVSGFRVTLLLPSNLVVCIQNKTILVRIYIPWCFVIRRHDLFSSSDENAIPRTIDKYK